jgi:cobalt-zinc-cadmium efflux system membrane fusion protein
MTKPPFPAVPRRRVLAAALAVATALAGCSSDRNAPAAATDTPHNVTLTAAQQQDIRLYTVAASSFHRTVDTTGTVDYDQDRTTAMLAPFSGPVTKVLAGLGETVKQGQPLATVASPDFAAAVDGYRKALAAARAAAQVAANDKDLFAHHAISARENAQAQADAIGAQSDSDTARAALLALNADPQVAKAIEQGRPVTEAQATIRAPMAGIVVQRQITPGQLLQAGITPCFTIADTATMWVQAQLFGSDLAVVRPGDDAEVTLGDGQALHGKVANVSPEVDPATRAVTARVVVKNPHGLLRKQLYVHVRIAAAAPGSGLLVPVGAVLRDDENLPFVYVREADGSYARRPVTLGLRTGDRYLVEQGLAAGDKVVTEGGIFLRFIQTQ